MAIAVGALVVVCALIWYCYKYVKRRMNHEAQVDQGTLRDGADVLPRKKKPPALYELHWLPVLARIQFKILLLAFKAIHGLAPVYSSNLLVTKRNSSYNIRSNSGILLQPPRGKMLTTLGERTFQAAAPHLWNELPLQLRTIESVETLKN